MTWHMSDLGNMKKQHVCSFLVMHLTSEPSKTVVEIDWFVGLFNFFTICSFALVLC